jgi:hypothetical protein
MGDEDENQPGYYKTFIYPMFWLFFFSRNIYHIDDRAKIHAEKKEYSQGFEFNIYL